MVFVMCLCKILLRPKLVDAN